MSEFVPIDEGNGFRVKTEDGVYHYSPMSDSIHTFADDKLDHVHYWDEENNRYMFQFMGRSALDFLHELGLPYTERESITRFEYEGWLDWAAGVEAEELDGELDALLGGEDGST